MIKGRAYTESSGRRVPAKRRGEEGPLQVLRAVAQPRHPAQHLGGRGPAVLAQNLEGDADDPSEVLSAFAVELQRLHGDRSVVINRTAISEAPAHPGFAQILPTQGTGSVVPKLERHLESQRARGRLLIFEYEETAVDNLKQRYSVTAGQAVTQTMSRR